MKRYIATIDEGSCTYTDRSLQENEVFMLTDQRSPDEVAQADGTWALPVETFDKLKADKINLAGQEFAHRRDAVRWVDGYGFDCAPEDITNFMSAYTPMLIKSVANPDEENATIYKVWLDSVTKGLREFSTEQLTRVYETVRSSQFEAYGWYEAIKAQIEAATTEEELDAIVWKE